MMIKLLVIADDFTGALDTGVQFSAQGILTLVTTKSNIDFLSIDKDIRVVVADIESRHISAAEAGERVKGIVKQAMRNNIEFFYKKTDSTMRGNIGSELSALLDVTGSKYLMFVPAYPQTGRTTLNGYQYVNGIPLSRTVFSGDPLNPVYNSYIPDIIKAQKDVNVITAKVPWDEELLNNLSNNPTIVVFDAQTDQDLLQIGRYLKETGNLRVMAGCAGFAGVLPSMMRLGTKQAKLENPPDGTLVICGSLNEVSLRQIHSAENIGYNSITIPPDVLLSEDPKVLSDKGAIVQSIVLRLKNKEKVIVKSVDDSIKISTYMEYGQNLGLGKIATHLRIAHNLGWVIKRVLEQEKVGTLVVFGGDTALGIVKAIQCDGIVPRFEIMPGVVVSVVMNNHYRMYMITKAGGFGDRDILLKIEQYFTNNRKR